MDLSQQLIALVQIIIIDFTLAGDNAIVVGLAASRVDPRIRAKVIFFGIAGAVVLRIMFAAVATQLLAIVGLTLAGGILLLWVCWKMYRELRLVHGHAVGPRRGWRRRRKYRRVEPADHVVRSRTHADRHRRRIDVAR